MCGWATLCLLAILVNLVRAYFGMPPLSSCTISNILFSYELLHGINWMLIGYIIFCWPCYFGRILFLTTHLQHFNTHKYFYSYLCELNLAYCYTQMFWIVSTDTAGSWQYLGFGCNVVTVYTGLCLLHFCFVLMFSNCKIVVCTISHLMYLFRILLFDYGVMLLYFIITLFYYEVIFKGGRMWEWHPYPH